MLPARTVAGVASLGLRLSGQACASAGVDLLGLPDDEAVLDQLPHVLPCKEKQLESCLKTVPRTPCPRTRCTSRWRMAADKSCRAPGIVYKRPASLLRTQSLPSHSDNLLTGVGHGNLVNLIWVEPNLRLITTRQPRCGRA